MALGSVYLSALVLALASLATWLPFEPKPLLFGLDLRRLFALAVAILSLRLALVSPLDELSDRLFSAHMVEHELFLYTIPIAALAARPVPLAAARIRHLPARWRRSLGRLTKSQPLLLRLARFLSHPATACALFVLALWAWHAPALYDLALRHPWAHVLEHASFLATALLYWQALWRKRKHTGLDSNGKRALYLIAGGMPGGLLGGLIALSGHVIYVGYLAEPHASIQAVLADQQLGGAIMWFSGAIFTAAITALVMK